MRVKFCSAPAVHAASSPNLQACLRRYNKQEADFASRSEYDNYLEEREDISAPPGSWLLALCW